LHHSGVRHATEEIRPETNDRVQAKIRTTARDEIIKAKVLREEYSRVIFQRSSSQRRPTRPPLLLSHLRPHSPRFLDEPPKVFTLFDGFEVIGFREPKRYGQKHKKSDHHRRDGDFLSLASASRSRRVSSSHHRSVDDTQQRPRCCWSLEEEDDCCCCLSPPFTASSLLVKDEKNPKAFFSFFLFILSFDRF
jgi:hypothetical protein